MARTLYDYIVRTFASCECSRVNAGISLRFTFTPTAPAVMDAIARARIAFAQGVKDHCGEDAQIVFGAMPDVNAFGANVRGAMFTATSPEEFLNVLGEFKARLIAGAFVYGMLCNNPSCDDIMRVANCTEFANDNQAADGFEFFADVASAHGASMTSSFFMGTGICSFPYRIGGFVVHFEGPNRPPHIVEEEKPTPGETFDAMRRSNMSDETKAFCALIIAMRDP